MGRLSIRKTGHALPVAAALKALDRLAVVVRSAASFEVIDAAARDAAAIQYRFRPVTHVAARAGEVWIDAEQRLGDELAAKPRAKGAAGRGKKGAKRGTLIEPRIDAPTLAELGVAKRRAARAIRLAGISKVDREIFTAELMAAEKGITPHALLQKLREHNKRDKKHATITAAFSADGPFDVVVIDPPWPIAKIDREVTPDQDAFDYPTMTVEEIIAFWQTDITQRMAPDCHVFFWTTQKYLPITFEVLKQIDLRYVFTMVWHKPGGFQPFDLPQYNCEFIVYGRRGAPLFVDTKDFNCCFDASRREHSRKPDEFYDTIRRVTGGSRVDVFSREPREGFAQYGNQPNAFPAVA